MKLYEVGALHEWYENRKLLSPKLSPGLLPLSVCLEEQFVRMSKRGKVGALVFLMRISIIREESVKQSKEKFIDSILLRCTEIGGSYIDSPFRNILIRKRQSKVHFKNP